MHTLSSHLSELGFILDLDRSAEKDLFKRNFLIMNALYQLQETLYPDNWLQVQAMDIVLFASGHSYTNQIDHQDPLRDYYLDWNNYEADEGEVKRLLNDFWNRYQDFVGSRKHTDLDRAQALNLFELPENACAIEIRRKWRKLALRWHPDREGGDSEQFRLLCEAWNVLRVNSSTI